MNRFYRAAVTKRPVGTAVEYVEPEVRGQLVAKVSDSTTQGDHVILVVDVTDEEHKANLSLSGIEDLSEDDAVNLAPRYQPKRRTSRFNRETMRREDVDMPAADLKRFAGGDKPRPRRRSAAPSRANRTT